MPARCQVKQVITALGTKLETLGLNAWQLRTLSAIMHCRTSAMGGRIERCDACGKEHLFYNSCRNRHCPTCQGHKREQWLQAREAEVLPVAYYHLVFTLPSELNILALYNPKALYSILFKATWATLKQFGGNQGVRLGMIAVLHTWGQNLSLHPHLHCMVPKIGIDKNGKHTTAGKPQRFLYPVKALSKVFRAKFVALMRTEQLGNQQLFDVLFSKPWVVYAKRPFGSPKAVIEYLGRYTHKIAISNHRIRQITNTHVEFTYKDYRHKGKKKIMTLTHDEFIRRFAMHIMPKRFVRIRHYGILSSSCKKKLLPKLQIQLGQVPVIANKTSLKGFCPSCKIGRLRVILEFDSRGPPKHKRNGIPYLAC